MPRKKVVAPTLRELVDKIGKNEGKTRNEYTSLLNMEKDLVPLYDIKPDFQRNKFVATRLPSCDCGKPVMMAGVLVCGDCAVEAVEDIEAGCY